MPQEGFERPAGSSRGVTGANDKPLFLSGLVFLVIGVAGVLIARRYPMGSVGNMGPGYFPVLLSALLCIIGALSVVTSILRAGRREVASWPIVPALSVALGVFVFGLTVERVGLIIASVLLLACIGHKQIRTRPIEYLLLSIALVIFSALIFVKMLGLPLNLWPEI
jgi:hypothetical protein